MKLFLDTSVCLAACGSETGASRELFRRWVSNRWMLLASAYVVREVALNLSHFPDPAAKTWAVLQSQLVLREDIFSLDRPVVFGKTKDRPVLLSALAWADILLTLDQVDFGGLMDRPFYGLRIMRPGLFLQEQRAAGTLV